MRPRSQVAGSENIMGPARFRGSTDVGANRKHRYTGMPKEFLRHRSEDNFAQSTAAVGADNDQVNSLLAGPFQQAIGRGALEHADTIVHVFYERMSVAQHGLQ